MKSAIIKILFCILVNLGFIVFCQASETGGKVWTFDQKLPAPKKFSPAEPGGHSESAFEKQFRIDTGETNLTRRAEFDRPMRLGGLGTKDRLRFKFDLSAWPSSLRPLARMWIAVGASSAITADGTLELTFFQNGVGMSTELNNTYTVDGTVLMGSDFAVKDGEATVEIENRTHLAKLDYTLHAIVYMPRKIDPDYLPAKP